MVAAGSRLRSKAKGKPPAPPKTVPKKAPPTPKPGKAIAPTTPEAPTKGVKRKKAKGGTPRPSAPVSFTWAEGSTLLSSWYDEGLRVAGAIVGACRYVWSEEQERWLEQVELVQFQSLSARNHVTLLGTHGHWMGPRETSYELREPTALEMVSIREVIRKEAVLQKAQRAPQPTKNKPVSETKVAQNKNDQQRIHLLKKENPYKGKRAEMHSVLREGMSVADYLQALRDRNLRPERWTLGQDVKKGLVELRSPKEA